MTVMLLCCNYSSSLLFLCMYVVGDLEVTCFTNSTGDIINGHDVLLQCNANQIVAYTCRVNGQLVQPCEC